MDVKIIPSILEGEIKMPSSKSQTMRAILFASFAKGQSIIHDFLPSPDIDAMIEACRLLGASIQKKQQSLLIEGFCGQPKTPSDVIDTKNSGIVLRFIPPIACFAKGYTVITGDASIRFNRPLASLINGLKGLGGFCLSTKQDDHAPLVVKGPLKAGEIILDGQDSQPVSALLIATSFLKGKTTIEVRNPGELPWIEMTLQWLEKFKIPFKNYAFEKYEIFGPNSIDAFEYRVPKDFSSAAFFLVAGTLRGKNVVLKGLDFQQTQADKILFEILQQMGVRMQIFSQTVSVQKTQNLEGRVLDMNACIDSVPIFAVLACFLKGKTKIINVEIARKKESDRLQVMYEELKKMGAKIDIFDDGLNIEQSELKFAKLNSHKDHRIAMALCVAALMTKEGAIIQDIACVKKSYFSFFSDLQSLGAKVEFL